MNLVLKETSKEEDVRLIAAINGWVLVAEYPNVNNTPHQIQWNYNLDTFIVFVEDFLLELNYLVIEGLDMEIVKNHVINGLEIYSEEDVLGINSEALDDSEVGNLIKVACLIAPRKFDEGFFKIFLKAFNSKSIDVQRVAVFAVNYVPWIQFREILLKCKNDNPEISIDIDVVVQANDSHGWL